MTTWPHLQYNLSNVVNFCWRHHELKLWRHNLYFKIHLFWKPKVTNFLGIIKIAIMLIKTTFKDSKNVKAIRNHVSKCNLYLYFLICQKLLITGEKLLMSAELRVCVTCFICFIGSCLGKVELGEISSL